MAGLNPQQKKFCELFDLYRNGARAAHEAGYGKDRESARYRSRDLLKDPEITAYIEQLETESLQILNITKRRVLKELAAIAFSDISNYVDWNDQIAFLKDSKELKPSQRKAVLEIRNDHTGGGDDGSAKGIVKIKLHDKVRALEKLGTHVGLFKETTVHEAGGSLEALIVASMAPKE